MNLVRLYFITHSSGMRRIFFLILLLPVFLVLSHATDPTASTVDAKAALAKLKAGNARFTSQSESGAKPVQARRAETAQTQKPFAIVLGCADSRTPPELIFDQNLGDLFVVRVAGNVLNDHVLGSIEYAVEHLGTRLIVVLGHERCGAVQAAKSNLATKSTSPAPDHIASLLTALRPPVEATAKADLDASIHANVRHVVQALRSSEPVLKKQVSSGAVSVLGAYYDLDTGRVEFEASDSQ
jgi:carbonic anhydrase